ncbi:hypothetical protein VDIAB_271158 [Vibrio diabolicus]|nr:hypothetical protein VDIAB_271158 [Vibrio diabolicus]
MRLMRRVGEQASLKVGELQSSLYLFSLNVFFYLHYKCLDFHSFHSKHFSQEVHDKSMRLIFLIGNDQMYLY